jgi:predicted phosphodiesterase
MDMAVTDIVLHGHTHKAEIILEDGLLKMNPGHLKGQRDKNMEPSFGLLDIGNREINATIFNLSFKPIQTMHILRAENGLYKA